MTENQVARPGAKARLDPIGKLYTVEAEVTELVGEARRSRLRELRRERSRKLINETRTWLMHQAARPCSGLGNAIS